MRDLDLMLRAFFPTPMEPTKFSPIGAMKQLLWTMLKDKPSLVLQTPSNDQQIVLASAQLLTGKKEFKKFFNVSTTRNDKQKQTHICIGCHVLSNRSLGNIKFKSNDNHLLAWLKKARVLIKADSLGTAHLVTIGYFTKIEPKLTHLTNFRDHLATQLMMIDLDAKTTVTLAPHLKTQQLEAMTNGDDYIPILPNFKVYKMRITHGHKPSQVTTDVIGIKGAPQDAKLLGEFFTRLATDTSNDPRDGVYLPKGAIHHLGLATFEQVLKTNNFFFTTVATVPVNMEYNAWFAVIDANDTSEMATISLYDHLLCQPWFLCLEAVTRNKTIIVTTKPNLLVAHAWIDENLEKMIRKSIPPDIEPPPSYLLPRRLDKPIYTEASRSYADILKQQFSLDSTAVMANTANNRPPRKRQATQLDYDSDQLADYTLPTTTVRPNPSNAIQTSHATTRMTESTQNATSLELLTIKDEIKQLKTIIAMAVAQITKALESLPTNNHTSPSNDEMDMDATPPQPDPKNATDPNTPTTFDLLAIINKLKTEILNFTQETRAIVQT